MRRMCRMMMWWWWWWKLTRMWRRHRRSWNGCPSLSLRRCTISTSINSPMCHGWIGSARVHPTMFAIDRGGSNDNWNWNDNACRWSRFLLLLLLLLCLVTTEFKSTSFAIGHGRRRWNLRSSFQIRNIPIINIIRSCFALVSVLP